MPKDSNLTRSSLPINGTERMKMMTLKMPGTKVIPRKIKAKIQQVKKQRQPKLSLRKS
jgi:hypothetical protein